MYITFFRWTLNEKEIHMAKALSIFLILFAFCAGYIFPALAVWAYFGWIWGVVAFVLPVLSFFSSGCLRVIFTIGWYILGAIAAVSLFGWWFVLVLLAWVAWWIIILAILAS